MAIAAALALAVSCSPEKRHEVLSFFFDGVPEPGAESVSRPVSPQYLGDDVPRALSQVNMTFHAPYRDGKCDTCHPKERSRSVGDEMPADICSRCHEHDAFRAKLDGFAFLHGPVAVEACLQCHDPHESLHPGLLSDSDPRLCYGCHEKKAVQASAAHAALTRWKCLECHDPHGGETRSFVRSTALPQEPSATRPAEPDLPTEAKSSRG